MKHLKTRCQGQHHFEPITWSLTPTMRTAHEFMCGSCLMVVTRTDIDKVNDMYVSELKSNEALNMSLGSGKLTEINNSVISTKEMKE